MLPDACGPSWNQAVEEGLGVYLSGDFDPLARARQQAICAGAWPPLTSFDGSDRDYLGAAVLVAWFDASAGRDAVRQLYASRDRDATAAALSDRDAAARQSAVCRWLDNATMSPALLPVAPPPAAPRAHALPNCMGPR